MRTQPLRSPRLLKKKRKRIIMRLVFSVVIALLILCGPALMLRLPFWTIHTVSVVGNGAVAEESIKQIAFDSMQGSYLYVYPKLNILLYPKAAIKHAIEAQFSRIEEVKVSMKSLHEIQIEVIEQKPVAIWCKDNSKDCYFMNASGFIFDTSPEFTNNVYMAYSGNDLEEPIGTYFVQPDEFSTIQSIVSQVKNLTLTPVSVDALPDNDYAVLLSTGETIFVTTRQSADATISNLESVLSDPKLGLRKGDGLSVFSIDLRFGNKVFYKQKGK